MASDAEAAGSKREREEDDREEEAPAAKESRVDADAADAAAESEAPDPAADPTADPAADPAADAPAPDAANQLAEALEMLAPKVTKRLDQLHESGLVGEGEIDAQTLLQLGELTPKEAVDVIDMLTKESLEGVENKSAHVQELMRRHKAAAAPAPAAAPAHAPAPPAVSSGEGMTLRNGQTLSPVVSDALQRLWATGAVTQPQIDDRMLEHLAQMPEQAAAAAVDELGRSDLAGIRNVSAFFKSICRRHGGGGPPGGAPGGGFVAGGGQPAPPEAFFEIQRRYQMGVITQPVAMRLEQFFADTGASLDSGAWDIMLQLNEMAAMAAIEEVHGACRGDRAVRNPSAYFTGIARKHLAAMQNGMPFAAPGGGGYGGYQQPGGYGGGPPGGGGYGGYGGGPPGGGGGRGGGAVDDATLRQRLPPAVYQRLDAASHAGKFHKHAIDERALSTMLQLDEATAMLVIDEIENTDLGRIRNFAGYFMGICNKFLRGGPPGAPQRY